MPTFKLNKLNIMISKNETSIIGQLTKYKGLDIQITPRFGDFSTLHIGIVKFKRHFADLVFGIEFNILHIYFALYILDWREWDDYTDKPITEEEAEKIDYSKRTGKPKYKPRRQDVQKWYYSSRFLKLYNFDYLNNPYGVTIDLALLPALLYTTLETGIHPRHSFAFNFELNFKRYQPIVYLEISLFSLYFIFEFGINNILRKSNLKYFEDFKTIITNFAYKKDYEDITEVINKEIERKILSFIKQVFDIVDINKLDTDDILKTALYDDMYKQEIFDFLLEKISTFNDFEDIEEYQKLYNSGGLEKLYKKFK